MEIWVALASVAADLSRAVPAGLLLLVSVCALSDPNGLLECSVRSVMGDKAVGLSKMDSLGLLEEEEEGCCLRRSGCVVL